MSSFLVSNKHINYIVSYALAMDFVSTQEEAQKLGEKFLRANLKSIKARYSDCNVKLKELNYKFEKFRVTEIGCLAVRKLMACLDYQSCDYEGWDKSSANAFLKKLSKDLEKGFERIYIVPYDKVPEYEKALWSID